MASPGTSSAIRSRRRAASATLPTPPARPPAHRLQAAGGALLAPGAPLDGLSQAEGYRYLARLARAGLENYLECADVDAPALTSIANGMRPAPIKLGSDNPDSLYEHASIDGAREYVVRGERGGCMYLGLGTQSDAQSHPSNPSKPSNPSNPSTASGTQSGSYGGEGGLATVDYVEAEAPMRDAAPTRDASTVGIHPNATSSPLPHVTPARRSCTTTRRGAPSLSSSRRPTRVRPTRRCATGCGCAASRERRCSSCGRFV